MLIERSATKYTFTEKQIKTAEHVLTFDYNHPLGKLNKPKGILEIALTDDEVIDVVKAIRIRFLDLLREYPYDGFMDSLRDWQELLRALHWTDEQAIEYNKRNLLPPSPSGNK